MPLRDHSLALRRNGPESESPVCAGPVSPRSITVEAMTDWEEVVTAVGVALGGDKDLGLRELTACWDGTTKQTTRSAA